MHLSSIFIENTKVNDCRFSCETENSDVLENLTKINIFVGSNNSGKSKFLRKLYSADELGYLPNPLTVTELNKPIKSLIKSLKENHIDDTHLSGIKEIKYINRDFDYKKNIADPLHNFQINRIYAKGGEFVNQSEIKSRAKTCLEQLNRFDIQSYKVNPKDIPKRMYIPTLRGLRGFGEKASPTADVYLERTKNDYFNSINSDEYLIFTGLHLYEQTRNLLLGTFHDREKIRKFENFLSTSFFNNKRINLIPRIGDNVIHVLIDDEEYPIHQLGDGIQAIIILTYPLFFNSEEKFLVFIEEPEHYLHPGFQRIFIETLLKDEFKNFQFFITTHSNHLLDMTLDFDKISIYTFNKKTKNEIIIENVENENTQILDFLGVKNSSVFLSNCTIWVEGITDRVYLRKYLQIYQKQFDKKFIEDLHYSFVEYGGNNITHWSFLNSQDPRHKNIDVKKLCGKLFLITDKDGAGIKKDGTAHGKKNRKFERHLELKKNLEDRYYCLESREIENVLSPNVLVSTIQSYDAEACCRIKYLNQGTYKNELLGSFIDSNFDNLERSYKASSGTISDKVNFAKRAVEQINSLENMSEEAKIIVKKIYSFIKANN